MKRFSIAISLLVGLSATSSLAQSRGSGQVRGRSMIDRLLTCEQDKRDLQYQMEKEIEDLRRELERVQNHREPVWSCQAGCTGLGNVGFGTGSSKAAAQDAALRNLGFICSHHTFKCEQEQ